jgi:hypothetical protein
MPTPSSGSFSSMRTAGLKDAPYVWSIQPYAHWFETDPREIAGAEAAGVETIASARDIAELFRAAPEK